MSTQIDVKAVVADIAREIRRDPFRWTQRRPARDKDGGGVHPTDPAAVCWCLSGHIEKRVGPVCETNGFEVYKALMKAMPERESVESWNDYTGRLACEAADLCEAVANG